MTTRRGQRAGAAALPYAARMDEHPNDPGLKHQAQLRTFFRIAGPVVAVVGGLASAYGFISFLGFGDSDPFASDPAASSGLPVGAMVLFMGGFLVLMAGAAMSRAGYASVAARYASGELSPVLRDTLQHTGLTPTEGSTGSGSGPYCRECGTRAPEQASKFCASCGTSLT